MPEQGTPRPPTPLELQSAIDQLNADAGLLLANASEHTATAELAGALELVATWLEVAVMPLLERPEVLERARFELTRAALIDRLKASVISVGALAERMQRRGVFRGLCTHCGRQLEHSQAGHPATWICEGCRPATGPELELLRATAKRLGVAFDHKVTIRNETDKPLVFSGVAFGFSPTDPCADTPAPDVWESSVGWRCTECGATLMHVVGPNVKALLCPDCDRDSSALQDDDDDDDDGDDGDYCPDCHRVHCTDADDELCEDEKAEREADDDGAEP